MFLNIYEAGQSDVIDVPDPTRLVIISDANCVINKPMMAPVSIDMDQVIALARVSAPKKFPAAYATPDNTNSTNATTGMMLFRSL
jgi:hypothetical protein